MAETTREALRQMDRNGRFPSAEPLAQLHCVCDSILAYLEATSPKHAAEPHNEGCLYVPPPSSLQDVVHDLNGSVKLFDDEALRCKAFDIMETCVLDHRMPPEDLIANTLLIAVHHCLTPPSVREHRAWVKKCYGLAPYLDMIELSTCPDFYHTLLLLVRTDVMNVEEGRKLIASLFCLSMQATVDLHTILRRSLLDFQRKAIWDCIGDIYFRAFGLADGQVALKLEELLQGYMEAAVKCGDEKMFRRLLCVLDAFHTNGDNKGVMGLLDRGYGPILFRALDYPNDTLRHNALRLFTHAFPIRNPDAPRQETGRRVGDQFAKLVTFLEDKNPIIRADAVEGICTVLHSRWSMIGAATALPALNVIFTDLAHDSSNKVVRLSVLRGAEILLATFATHQHLKGLLPNLAPCLHDAATVVRLAFVRLLKNVARIRHVAFWEAASIPQLIERMGRDPSEAVIEELVALLRHNFLPAAVDAAEQLQRCSFLVKVDAVAAMQFYRRVRKHCEGPAGPYSLLHTLVRWVVQCLAAQQGEAAAPPTKRAKTGASNGKKKGRGAPPEESGNAISHPDSMKERTQPKLACQDAALMQGVVNVVGCLVQSLALDWPKLATAELEGVLRGLLADMPAAYPQPDMAASCAWIAAIVPGQGAAVEDCVGPLRMLLSTAGKPTPTPQPQQWRLQLLSACLGGKLPQVLATVIDRLRGGQSNLIPLRFITYLLVNPQTRRVLLQAWGSDCAAQLEVICGLLQAHCTTALPRLLQGEVPPDPLAHRYAVAACNVLSRLTLHRHFLHDGTSAAADAALLAESGVDAAGNLKLPTKDRAKPKAKPKSKGKGSRKPAEDSNWPLPFTLRDLLGLYATVLPHAVDCFTHTTATAASTAAATTRRKQRKAGGGPGNAVAEGALDDFKAQLCETAVLWVEELLGCGTLHFGQLAQPLPGPLDGAVGSQSSPGLGPCPAIGAPDLQLTEDALQLLV
eukprot:GGOE01056500.1.p1 GENE.GGOE01056500.1~~GGOE01056500.1.p1  ORF type:complete len:1026 (-),score=355.63 GGOE01056500.1:25-2940(-)